MNNPLKYTYTIYMKNKKIILINQNNQLLAFELLTPISQAEIFELSIQLLSAQNEYTQLTFSKLGVQVIPLEIVSELTIN